jgi:hypothetical protein
VEVTLGAEVAAAFMAAAVVASMEEAGDFMAVR